MTDEQDVQALTAWPTVFRPDGSKNAVLIRDVAREWLQMHNALREIRWTWNLHFEPDQMHRALLEIDRICGSVLDIGGRPAMALTPTEMEHHAERVGGRESELETMRMLARAIVDVGSIDMGGEPSDDRPELQSWIEWAKGEYERE